eukprot:scaffold401584_cov19-Prasinocladus_malaysianus.AAC.1
MTLMRWPVILPNICICGGDEWWRCWSRAEHITASHIEQIHFVLSVSSLSWAAEPKVCALLQELRQQGETKSIARPQRNRRLPGQSLGSKPLECAKGLVETEYAAMAYAAGVISF